MLVVLFLFFGFFLFYCFLQIILHRFLSDFYARHVGSSANHMSRNRGRHEKKDQSDDQLRRNDFINEPEMDVNTKQYTHDTQCGALGSRVDPCIDVRKADQAKSRNQAEYDACTN